jgi:hypothetical protein
MHQEIPEDKLSRVSAYDWFGSIAMVPAGHRPGRPGGAALRSDGRPVGCATLVVVVTAAVLSVSDVRNLTRRTKPVAQAAPGPDLEPGSADAEGSAGRLG